MGIEAAILGLTIASGVMSATGAYKQGQSRKAAANYNAAVARQEGEAALQKAQVDTARVRKAARVHRSKQEALYAKAGVQLSGSPLEVLADSAAESIYDEMLIDYNARLDVSRAESSARYQTSIGKTYAREGLVKAGTTLLATGANAAFRYSNPSGSTGTSESGGT